MKYTDVLKKLNKAFVEDHRILIRGYQDAKSAIQANDLDSAKAIAAQLDRQAGPHIEFEETCLYPIVGAARGRTYVSRLYQEHEVTLQTLIDMQEATSMDEDAKARWLAGMQEGMEHAATCGTLLSHLNALPAEQMEILLDRLRSLQSQEQRWSEFAASR